jgi:NADPH-dependent 2,4-dienoyl-CoA reductase/sulfur reductase-like enzyme/ferredoxin
MATTRLLQHPILPVAPRADVPFTWDGRPCTAKAGEPIASAVLAHGARVFGHHPKDGCPQGLWCANGQCAQCLVLADGRPVKACTTPVVAGMDVRPLDGLPPLPADDARPTLGDVERREVPVLIVGGGPAGLAAAAELGAHGVPVLLVDDKDRLGGKLVLQTHRFFGSVEAVHAGTRGTHIGERLAREALAFDTTEVGPTSTALAAFADGWVGVWRGGLRYALVRPQVLLVATGSRERALPFRGNTRPGVLGAGAFQTLLNRDLVRVADRLFVIGGGNVGLITAYHALQAGVEVVGLAEAAPECGGYRVHRDKLARLGVPIFTSHTVLAAHGRAAADPDGSDAGDDGRVAAVTIARVDERFRPLPGTERTFACDAVLVAVGLDPVDELTEQARAAGIQVVAAGDAERIAEASAAMMAGRIRGREIAHALGAPAPPVPEDWSRTADLLRSKPGPRVVEPSPPPAVGVHPVFHCTQEIPCNPCTSVCPQALIHIDPDDLRQVPTLLEGACLGCERCVRVCPGLAITLVDPREDAERPLVTVPFEFVVDAVHAGDAVTLLDTVGGVLGEAEVVRVRGASRARRADADAPGDAAAPNAERAPRAAGGVDGTLLVQVRVPAAVAARVAGVRPRGLAAVGDGAWDAPALAPELADDEVVCRCERVTAGELRALIRAGIRDVNDLKARTRAEMGACGAKTCAPLITQLFREEGVATADVTPGVRRPPFVEVPLGVFAGIVEP